MTVNSLINFGVPGLVSEPIRPIAGNHFKVDLLDFGDLPSINEYGRFVKTITTPSLMFSCQERFQGSKPIFTAEEARWQPVFITLTDDLNGDMLRQVTIQTQKQKRDPRNALFTMYLSLFDQRDGGKEIRSYEHRGCTIIYAAHERALDRNDASRLNFVMQVQVNDVEARSYRHDDNGGIENVLYEPIDG